MQDVPDCAHGDGERLCNFPLAFSCLMPRSNLAYGSFRKLCHIVLFAAGR